MNEEIIRWFSLDPLEKFCLKYGFRWWYVLVISPNGPGKTTYMINTFIEREKASLLTGFLVRDKTDDHERILGQLKNHGSYSYRQKSYELFRNDHIIKKIMKGKKEIEKEVTIKTKVGYIVNMHDAHDVKSFNFYDADLWFFDEVTNVMSDYEKKEKKRLMAFLKTAARLNKNFRIILFGNADDPNYHGFDLFKRKGIKMDKEFTIFPYSKDPKIIWVLWKYETNQVFKQNLKGTIIDIIADADEDESKMALTTTGVKSEKDYYLMDIKFGKILFNIKINEKWFSIYQKGKYRIIGYYETKNKKKRYDINSSSSWFYRNYLNWKRKGILKWESLEIQEEIQQILIRRSL